MLHGLQVAAEKNGVQTLERQRRVAHCAYKETTEKLPQTLFTCAMCDLTLSPPPTRQNIH